MATRHKEFASLCRKVMAMKNKVIEKHEKERNNSKNSPEETISEDAEIPVEVVGEDSEENLIQVVQ
jgi:hypothetical protein